MAGLLATLLLLGACAPVYDSAPILGPLDTSDPQVELGERAFAFHCGSCHPNASSGVGPSIVNVPVPGWAIRFQVRNGFGQMPAFSEEELPREELDAIVAYIDALRTRLREATPVEPPPSEVGG